MDCLVNDEFYDLWIFIALTLTNIGYIFTIFTEKFVNMCNGTCMYLEYEITVGKNRDKYIYIYFIFLFLHSLSLFLFLIQLIEFEAFRKPSGFRVWDDAIQTKDFLACVYRFYELVKFFFFTPTKSKP